MPKAKRFELVIVGVDAESYFQGAGTAFTDWDHVEVGIGDSEKEAAEDAIENLAMSDWDIDGLDFDADLAELSEKDEIAAIANEQGLNEVTEDFEELHVYAKLYVAE